MKELILVRHGESEHEVENLTGGWTSHRLTKLGRIQALKTGLRLKELLITDVDYYCSDIERASETAKIIGDLIGKSPINLSGLRGLNNGDASGVTKQTARSFELPKNSHFHSISYKNAESIASLYKRVFTFMDSLPQHNNMLIVTHAKTITCIVNWWIGIKEEQYLSNIIIHTDFCSITHLKKDSTGCSIIQRLNDTSHLL